MSTDGLQFQTVFCDDIRREDNGKLLLVGVYQDNILVNFPTSVSLTLWVRFQNMPAGDHQLAFELLLNGKTSAEGGADFSTPDSKASGGFILPRLPLDLVEPGEITFLVGVDDHQKKLAGTLPVMDASKIRSQA